jgi:serine phosphatase RsbU (regulator of sigma subunit)
MRYRGRENAAMAPWLGMNLRLRLIVVFFLLSVVPVGAVTFYTYASNAQAIRDAASAEAELLAAELTGRMRAMTAQLSQRVGALMELPEPPKAVAASESAPTPSPAPAPAPAPAAAPMPDIQLTASDLDQALGDFATLIDNIEVRGRRRDRPTSPRPDRRVGGGPGGGVAPDEPADPNRIDIDLREMRRTLFDELAPDRAAFEALPPDERQKVLAQVEQRMQGVTQGISALQKALASRAPAPRPRPTVPAAPPAPPMPAARPQVPTPPPPPAMRRSSSLSGRRLAVRVERGGELLGLVNADVDLPKLLATVFAATPRDRGELPFAVGEGGELYTATATDKSRLEAMRTSAVSAESKAGTTVLGDWIVATTPDPTGSRLKFGIARPVGEALRDLQASSARNAALGFGFIGLALIVIVPLSGRLTRNLDTLSAGVHRIAGGDYSARVPVRSTDEIGRLAVAFNQMAADVEEHQRSAISQERIRRELELGRQIQHDMLPQAPLRLGLTEIKGVSVPAREVGGDFFNYFLLRDGTIALLVGDVSGKGVGAALLMANLQAALRTRLALGQDLASLAQELDVDIDRTTPGPVYATLFVATLDPVARRLRWVNAGHHPQYVVRTDGRLHRMESTGRPIGLLSGGGYIEQHVEVMAGDVLFFYTDGCVEAENASGDMFGSEELERALTASAGLGADQVMVAVESEISRFRSGVELTDDATMMVVKVG